MNEQLNRARQNFIEGMSRISNFWGFPRAMGALFGALYLSPKALSLDELAGQASISKGAASTNMRNLERLGMVHKEIRLGERRDYYIAETDFWQMIKNILREREKPEFDLALRTVGESRELARTAATHQDDEAELARFYSERMAEMERFFHTLDNLVATALALEELRSGALEKLLKGRSSKEQSGGQ